jgi:hypothetical protein
MRCIVFDIHSDHLATLSTRSHEVVFFNPLAYLNPEALTSTSALVQSHRRQDRKTREFLQAVKAQLKEGKFEIICAHQSVFPPEWLIEECHEQRRVLGCFDDPQATYTRTLPSIVGYHGAYYCSPSYSDTQLTRDVFRSFGIPHTHWFPPSSAKFSPEHCSEVLRGIDGRANTVVYVGKCYGSKVDRLARLHQHLGKQLIIHGKDWPLRGGAGFLAPIRGRRYFPRWVRPISPPARQRLYLSSKVGFNMHLGEQAETGNMRMYETTAHGLVLLCDKAATGAHASIFEPNVEALFYSSTEEAIDLIERCFRDTRFSCEVAMAGFERCRHHYSLHNVLDRLITWAGSIPGASGNRAG